jgi:hypothetical protein
MPSYVQGLDVTSKLWMSANRSVNESLQPSVSIAPDVTVNWVVGEKFRADVSVENVSGMGGLYFELYWDGSYDSGVADYSQVLNTSTNDIAVFETLLPKPYKAYSLSLNTGAGRSWLKFLCVPDCVMTSPQNGTGKIMSINFTVLDPWTGGRQPAYSQGDCSWTPNNATSRVAIWWGYVLLQYPSAHYVYFGQFYGSTRDVQGYAVYGQMEFTFMPVPGDLDGNGVVDAGDLAIITQFYNKPVSAYPNAYYDLNGDGVIDIYDVVIVARNYGRNSPY